LRYSRNHARRYNRRRPPDIAKKWTTTGHGGSEPGQQRRLDWYFVDMTELLRTTRLVIRRFAPTDLGDFCAYQGDPRVRQHQPGKPMDVEAAARYLSTQADLDERATGRWHGYACQHVESGAVIGDVGVFLVSATEGDVGFQFHPHFHRQGYGREATTAFLGHVFATLGLERVTAACARANTASQALLNRLGLKLRPTAPDEGCRYELRRDDWAKSRDSGSRRP
jgi:ribosomal-protein-alanine N-acetyltransferase